MVLMMNEKTNKIWGEPLQALAMVGQQAVNRLREEAHAAGEPWPFVQDGKKCLEWPNGEVTADKD